MVPAHHLTLPPGPGQWKCPGQEPRGPGIQVTFTESWGEGGRESHLGFGPQPSSELPFDPSHACGLSGLPGAQQGGAAARVLSSGVVARAGAWGPNSSRGGTLWSQSLAFTEGPQRTRGRGAPRLQDEQ